MTAIGGQTPIMRPLLPALLAALLTMASVALADDPPSTPLILRTPAAGSDLPDMGSPAAAVLSHTDEYRLGAMVAHQRSEEHTSELQSHLNLVCRLLLEKKKTKSAHVTH